MIRILFAVLLMSTATLAAANDEPGVRAVITSFTKAWNAHNAHAMAEVWEESGDLIDPWGKKGTSKRAIESIFIGDQRDRFKDSTMTQTIDRVRFLTPDIAIVDATAKLVGAKNDQGKSITLDHHVVWVLRFTKEGWKVAAARPYVFAPKG